MGLIRKLSAQSRLWRSLLLRGCARAGIDAVLPPIDVWASRTGTGIVGASNSIITAEDIARSPERQFRTSCRGRRASRPGARPAATTARTTVVDLRGFGVDGIVQHAVSAQRPPVERYRSPRHRSEHDPERQHRAHRNYARQQRRRPLWRRRHRRRHQYHHQDWRRIAANRTCRDRFGSFNQPRSTARLRFLTGRFQHRSSPMASIPTAIA